MRRVQRAGLAWALAFRTVEVEGCLVQEVHALARRLQDGVAAAHVVVAHAPAPALAHPRDAPLQHVVALPLELHSLRDARG